MNIAFTSSTKLHIIMGVKMGDVRPRTKRWTRRCSQRFSVLVVSTMEQSREEDPTL